MSWYLGQVVKNKNTGDYVVFAGYGHGRCLFYDYHANKLWDKSENYTHVHKAPEELSIICEFILDKSRSLFFDLIELEKTEELVTKIQKAINAMR